MADDVFIYGNGKVSVILKYGTEDVSVFVQIIFLDVYAVIENFTIGNIIESQKQLNKS